MPYSTARAGLFAGPSLLVLMAAPFWGRNLLDVRYIEAATLNAGLYAGRLCAAARIRRLLLLQLVIFNA